MASKFCKAYEKIWTCLEEHFNEAVSMVSVHVCPPNTLTIPQRT